MSDDQDLEAPPGEDAEAAPPEFKPPSALEALKQPFAAFRRPAAGRTKAQPASGSEDDRLRVTFIDKRERIIGFFLGGVLAALGIALYFEFRHYFDKGHPKLTSQAHHAAPEVLAIGLIVGVLIVGATFSKRRALLGFSLLLGGLAVLQTAGIFGFVYLGVGLWMVFRALRRPRPSPAGATAAAGTGGRANASAAARTSTATTATSSSYHNRSTKRSGFNKPSAGPAAPRVAPPPSKRYTPPRPNKRPAPPPEKPAAEESPGNRLTAWLRR